MISAGQTADQAIGIPSDLPVRSTMNHLKTRHATSFGHAIATARVGQRAGQSTWLAARLPQLKVSGRLNDAQLPMDGARPHEVPPGGHPFGLWNPWAAVLGWDVQRRGSGHERTFGGDLRSPEASGRAEGYGGRPSASRGTRSASTAFPLTGHAPWESPARGADEPSCSTGAAQMQR